MNNFLHRLEWAARNDHLEVVNCLLANDAIIDERTFALQLMAEISHLDVVKTLLANDAVLRCGHLELHPEVAETIEKHIPSAQQPCSLMHGCRATIRDRLIKHLVDGKPLEPAIDSLPLPPGMREYLYNPLQW
ncbi:hypothetical protein [Endozoicomonas sp. GU-1]|uniref:hypothetical protein n=1 Tax=Endozoicomonas sp. GU-1 TaxID=3009078 RepID=UPI0022B5071B|nr:hypothetical protein [Endozoicomonas sp. GU-1]WBA83078.1 hypothetical protein O2T12_08165 [Endozoicomonas sp. GU-1]WBA86002.1 hypothetical protein O3276_22800 [Endozoicomonas sp. GU-1]